MENLNIVIAKNLVKFRTLSGITQAELAKKIQYSDKSISKWERGDGIPDVAVLVKLSEIYGVSLNDFVVNDEEVEVLPKKVKTNSHLLISFLSAGVVWLVASIVFVVLSLIPQTKSIAWFSFIYAIPFFAIVLTVFACKWGPIYLRAMAISLILWGTIISVCLTINLKNIWLICIIGGICELLIILGANLRKVSTEQKKLLQKLKNLFKFKQTNKPEQN